MNELGLTHIDSLDSETVSIPGLDIAGDLEKTILLGKKKIRKQKLIKGLSAISVLTVATLAFLGGNAILNSPEIGVPNSVIKAAQNQMPKAETLQNQEVPILPTQEPIADVPPATQVPLQKQPTQPPIKKQLTQNPQPKLIVLKSFGNPALCNVSSNPDPGPGGVIVGSGGSHAEPWYPTRIGQSRLETVLANGRQLVIKITAPSNGVRVAYADLVSGFDSANSYLNVTTLGMRYCETGYMLAVNPLDAGGYSVQTPN